jgi:hypothetical protein
MEKKLREIRDGGNCFSSPFLRQKCEFRKLKLEGEWLFQKPVKENRSFVASKFDKSGVFDAKECSFASFRQGDQIGRIFAVFAYWAIVICFG